MSALLDLPDELIIYVLSKLADETDVKRRLSPLAPGHQAIASLAQTCRKAWAISEPFLFSAVILCTGEDVALFNDLARFNHKRTRFLQDLAVVVREEEDGILELADLLASLSPGNLKRLHIEPPFNQVRNPFWRKFRQSLDLYTQNHQLPLFSLPWTSNLEHCTFLLYSLHFPQLTLN
jgi:hypothetical protein